MRDRETVIGFVQTGLAAIQIAHQVLWDLFNASPGSWPANLELEARSLYVVPWWLPGAPRPIARRAQGGAYAVENGFFGFSLLLPQLTGTSAAAEIDQALRPQFENQQLASYRFDLSRLYSLNETGGDRRFPVSKTHVNHVWEVPWTRRGLVSAG